MSICDCGNTLNFYCEILTSICTNCLDRKVNETILNKTYSSDDKIFLTKVLSKFTCCHHYYNKINDVDIIIDSINDILYDLYELNHLLRTLDCEEYTDEFWSCINNVIQKLSYETIEILFHNLGFVKSYNIINYDMYVSSNVLKYFINNGIIIDISRIPYDDIYGKDKTMAKMNTFHTYLKIKKSFTENEIKWLIEIPRVNFDIIICILSLLSGDDKTKYIIKHIKYINSTNSSKTKQVVDLLNDVDHVGIFNSINLKDATNNFFDLFVHKYIDKLEDVHPIYDGEFLFDRCYFMNYNALKTCLYIHKYHSRKISHRSIAKLLDIYKYRDNFSTLILNYIIQENIDFNPILLYFDNGKMGLNVNILIINYLIDHTTIDCKFLIDKNLDHGYMRYIEQRNKFLNHVLFSIDDIDDPKCIYKKYKDDILKLRHKIQTRKRTQ